MYKSFALSRFRNIPLLFFVFFLSTVLFKLEGSALDLEAEYGDVIEEYRDECEGPFLCNYGDFCFRHLQEFSEERGDISKDVCSQLSKYGHLIPSIKKSCCELTYCPKCNSLVTPGIFYMLGDTDKLETGKCHCSSLWSHEILNLAIELEEDYDEDDAELEILNIERNWRGCKKSAIPAKYFQKKNRPLVSFLKQHLEYINENTNCSCYWPHRSKDAKKISGIVSEQSIPILNEPLLFKDLQVNRCNISDIEQLFTHTFFLFAIQARTHVSCAMGRI